MNDENTMTHGNAMNMMEAYTKKTEYKSKPMEKRKKQKKKHERNTI